MIQLATRFIYFYKPKWLGRFREVAWLLRRKHASKRDGRAKTTWGGCWKSLGGLAADLAIPIDEVEWFDKNKVSDTLCEKRNLRDFLFRLGGGVGSRGSFRPRRGITQGRGEAEGLRGGRGAELEYP